MENLKLFAKKLYSFLVVCAYVLATLGGTAYLFFDKHYLFGVVNLLLAAMAAPYMVKQFKSLING